MTPNSAPWLLRTLARLLLRGSDAPYVLGDLDEGYVHDLTTGLPRWRARLRYLGNTGASAIALARGRIYDSGLSSSWLDLKLGVRSLGKRPGLTAVTVFALAIGIPASMTPTHLARALSGTLPFEDGDRIVGLQNWDPEAGRLDRYSIHHFEFWREQLRGLESIGASRSAFYNVAADDGLVAPAQGSEMTASAFEVVGVEPLVGRTLTSSDELPGAPDVVVIGFDFWQSRMGSAPGAVGSTLRVGGTPHEVVGVMPEGFLFPVRDQLWRPLRTRAVDYEQGTGPVLRVFGRLADGVTLERANAEIAALSTPPALGRNGANAELRASVVPFTRLGQVDDVFQDPGFIGLTIVAYLLLGIACGNVGILVLARTAMRTSELAVRTALGAGRARIVSLIFIETLVMAVVAVGVGLALGDLVATKFTRTLDNELPFWVDFGVGAETVAFALALAVASAVLAGVIPALKATGRGIHSNMQRSAVGASGLRFGGLSSALIVIEVGVSVWFLTLGASLAPGAFTLSDAGMGIDPEAYLSAEVQVPWVAPTADRAESYEADFQERIATTRLELERRMASEPGVGRMAFADAFPGGSHPGLWVEVGSQEGVRHWVRTARVDIDFFEALDHPVAVGRGFQTGDLERESPEEAGPIVVNSSFVDRVLGGRNALGQRIRRVDAQGANAGPWSEVVGVVGRLGMHEVDPDRDAGFYRPAAVDELDPIRFIVRTPGDPGELLPRLREVVAEVAPEALVSGRPLDGLREQRRWDNRWGTTIFWTIALIAIVLSTAGLYALISFTVSERTREIGVRTALGAPRSAIVRAIGRRALLQLLGGIGLGVVFSVIVVPRMFDGPSMQHMNWPLVVAATGGIALMLGLASCIPPVLRGLRIQPVAALKQD